MERGHGIMSYTNLNLTEEFDYMSKRKRRIFLIIGFVLISLLVATLSLWASNNTFTYSNLMDNESKATAHSLLSDANIPQENIELFFTLVDEFNSVPYKGIVEQGWKKAFIPFFSYNNNNGFAHLEAQEQENMIICRSAAYILLKDHIIFNKTDIIPDRNLDNNNRFPFTEEDKLHYDLLFADIENSNTYSSKAVANKVVDYWNMAGIEFPESYIHFIMAYADTENGIQNFHTGVAIYNDDCVWFLEKADPIHPYQISCFDTQEQLINYMKKRVSETEYAVIFSNDTCIWKK